MARLKYYRKSRFNEMNYEVTPQSINKNTIIDYIILDGKNCKRHILEQFSWKKLIGLFYSMNYRDAINAFNKI